ncbi:hypothetical protein L3X38_012355 [Prunus dulcis]|uniref:Uncharacterized protein n=1 Tax=Prunus dulcis TaxID=3755 RepID=A0AAD4WJ46_PRUDU|nr:hypothetical protein L3X38_012355 [Prunus dulcis]
MDKLWGVQIFQDPAPSKVWLSNERSSHPICNMPKYPGTQLLCVDATPSLPTWGSRECPTTPNEAGMLGYNYKKLTSSQPRSCFSTANLGDYCLHHSEPSRPSIKATSTKAATPSPLPKEDTLPRCQTPAKAPSCQT